MTSIARKDPSGPFINYMGGGNMGYSDIIESPAYTKKLADQKASKAAAEKAAQTASAASADAMKRAQAAQQAKTSPPPASSAPALALQGGAGDAIEGISGYSSIKSILSGKVPSTSDVLSQVMPDFGGLFKNIGGVLTQNKAVDTGAIRKESEDIQAKVDAANLARRAANTTDVNKQFDIMRRNAQGTVANNTQAQKDALTRRFASLGNLDSGARLKQESLVEQQGQAALQNANDSIDANQVNNQFYRDQFESSLDQFGKSFAEDMRVNNANIADQLASQNSQGLIERLLAGLFGFGDGTGTGTEGEKPEEGGGGKGKPLITKVIDNATGDNQEDSKSLTIGKNGPRVPTYGDSNIWTKMLAAPLVIGGEILNQGYRTGKDSIEKFHDDWNTLQGKGDSAANPLLGGANILMAGQNVLSGGLQGVVYSAVKNVVDTWRGK